MANEYFYQGGSVHLRIVWKTHPRPGDTNPDTKDGVLVNPTSQTWKIKDPSGTVKATVHDTDVVLKESLGTYYYDYTLATDATVTVDQNNQRLADPWTCVGQAMIRGLSAVKVIEFDVREA